ncbi:hypothetical protein OO015_00640 [Thermomicrobium sp. 4228-Ro]|uniref:hypothetical protein n=1 Tax=Thermomicrobium sp. 4228-Ro TaxID=2993937 RepID=UPI002248A149|nr:hypothetical protein [Thermomicrobium sp. 4228-Ro]MCX2726014.1 hypothetical protein [Thermomicrobium sp. 4228-Ro]
MTRQCCCTGQLWHGFTPPPCRHDATGAVGQTAAAGTAGTHAVGTIPPDPVQDLREAGIAVEENPALRRVLAEHQELVTLLRGVAALMTHRVPVVTLLLRWYVDPEVSGDEHPVLVARLPSYDDTELVRRLAVALDDADQVLSASPVWVLATTHFEASEDEKEQRLLEATQRILDEMLALQSGLKRRQMTTEQGWRWLEHFLQVSAAEVLTQRRELGY